MWKITVTFCFVTVVILIIVVVVVTIFVVVTIIVMSLVSAVTVTAIVVVVVVVVVAVVVIWVLVAVVIIMVAVVSVPAVILVVIRAAEGGRAVVQLLLQSGDLPLEQLPQRAGVGNGRVPLLLRGKKQIILDYQLSIYISCHLITWTERREDRAA